MKILLAIDESECSDAAVDAVLAQFPPNGSEVRVLHVDEWPKGMPISLAFAEGAGVARSVLSVHEEFRLRAEGLMSRAVARLKAAAFRASSQTRCGDARREILDCAAEWHPDVIVLGSHGRTGLNRFLLGSVSESVVRHAPCSVEIVRA
jgi:universal stress protein A